MWWAQSAGKKSASPGSMIASTAPRARSRFDTALREQDSQRACQYRTDGKAASYGGERSKLPRSRLPNADWRRLRCPRNVKKLSSVLRTLAADEALRMDRHQPPEVRQWTPRTATRSTPVAAKPTSATRGASGPLALAPQQEAIQRDKLTHPRGVWKTPRTGPSARGRPPWRRP